MASALNRESGAVNELPGSFDTATQPTTRSLEVHTIAPLASVVVALHRSPSLSAQKVAALPHVVAAISDLTLSERWTIPRACKANLLVLLPYLAARYEVSRAQAQNHTRARDGGGDRRIPASADLYRSDPFFHALECRQGLVWAVAHDNLEMLEWLHAHCPSVLPYAAMVKAAEVGNVRLLQWLRARHPRAACLPEVMDAAAGAGQLEVLQWLQDDPASSFRCTHKAFECAAANGHLETLRLVRRIYNASQSEVNKAVHRAIEHGHSEVAKYLLIESGLDLNVQTATNCAAERGDLEMVQWLLSRSPSKPSRGAIWCAARGGQLEVVQWLHENLVHEDVKIAMVFAASAGHLDVYQWLHERCGSDHDTMKRAMDGAIDEGHLDVVRWIHANGGDDCIASELLVKAVSGGHLETAKWLHERLPEANLLMCPMDDAARDGHLDVLEWLHANARSECTAKTMNEAAANGHLEVLKWLTERSASNRNSPVRLASTAFDRAVENGRLKVAQWMHARGFEGTPAFKLERVAALGRLDIIKWLDEAGLTGDVRSHRAVTSAAQHGHLDVAMYLYLRYGLRGLLPFSFDNSKLWIQYPETMSWVCHKDRSKVNFMKLRERAKYMPALLEHVAASDIGRRDS